MSHALDSALESAERRTCGGPCARCCADRCCEPVAPRPRTSALVRRYAAELRSWFDANTGWRLIVDSEVARLVKLAPTTDDPTHPARDPRSRAPFIRRRYVLTCLALSVLERSDAQITLGAWPKE